MVLEIESTAHYTEVVTQAAGLPIVIDFFATWCGPCVMIKPIFETISHEYEGKAVFIKIDVDKCEELSAQFGIQAMPTFIVVKGGAPAATMKGANPEGLKKFVADNTK
jgi:thioredoxin 1